MSLSSSTNWVHLRHLFRACVLLSVLGCILSAAVHIISTLGFTEEIAYNTMICGVPVVAVLTVLRYQFLQPVPSCNSGGFVQQVHVGEEFQTHVFSTFSRVDRWIICLVFSYTVANVLLWIVCLALAREPLPGVVSVRIVSCACMFFYWICFRYLSRFSKITTR
jgi:hypothetical protein